MSDSNTMKEPGELSKTMKFLKMKETQTNGCTRECCIMFEIQSPP